LSHGRDTKPELDKADVAGNRDRERPDAEPLYAEVMEEDRRDDESDTEVYSPSQISREGVAGD
jgi:hypothetical protein